MSDDSKKICPHFRRPFLRFSRTVKRLKTILSEPLEYQERMRRALEEISSSEGYIRRVSVKRNHVYSIVPVAEIQCIKTSGGLVYLHLQTEEFQTDTTLNQFERRLDPEQFMLIHRTAIVNLQKITKIMPWGQGRYAVMLENGTSLQISREKIQEFKKKVGLKI